jgi:glycosyltransferase involved in cell wall biosynthesis
MTGPAARSRRSPHGSAPVGRGGLRHARVVVNGSPLWPPVTGVQRVARGLARRLLAEAEPGEVTVLGGPPGFPDDRDAGRTRTARLAWEQVVFPVLARRAEAVMNLGQLAPLAGVRGRSLVLTYDLHAYRLPHHYRALWGRTYWHMVVRAYHQARHRIALSATIAEDLSRTLGAPVDAVVPPGVDDPFRPATPARVDAVRARFGLDLPYLVVVGWAEPGKRTALALRAHRTLVGDLPHRLVLVGSRRTDFPALGLGEVPPSVTFTGRVSDDDLAALHSGSSGLLFCTEYEGFGLPSVEALACGAPVAASEIPVLREVLGGLPGVRFVEEGSADGWVSAAAALLDGRSSSQAVAERSSAVLARYPWEGKGHALLRVVAR